MSVEWSGSIKHNAQAYEDSLPSAPRIDISQSDAWKVNVRTIFREAKEIDWIAIAETDYGKYHGIVEEYDNSKKFVRFLVPDHIKDKVNITISNIFKQLTYYSNKDLDGAIEQSYVAWCESRGAGKWNLLSQSVPYLSKPTKYDFKSNDWIFKTLMQKHDMHPVCAFFKDAKESQMKELYNLSAESVNFVYFDEALYSGKQYESVQSDILYAFREVSYEMEVNKPINFVVVCGYISEYLLIQWRQNTSAIEKKETKNMFHLRRLTSQGITWSFTCYFSGIMPSQARVMSKEMENISLEAQHVVKCLLSLGKSLTIFEHKIADYASFPPLFADYLRPMLGYDFGSTEPYKNINAVHGTTKKVFDCTK
jgi:hypothetical protein